MRKIRCQLPSQPCLLFCLLVVCGLSLHAPYYNIYSIERVAISDPVKQQPKNSCFSQLSKQEKFEDILNVSKDKLYLETSTESQAGISLFIGLFSLISFCRSRIFEKLKKLILEVKNKWYGCKNFLHTKMGILIFSIFKSPNDNQKNIAKGISDKNEENSYKLASESSGYTNSKVSIESFHLFNTTTNVLDSYKEKAWLNRTRLNFCYELSEDILIRSDKICFEKMLDNLIGNAVKYCGEQGTILIRVHESNSKLRIKVSVRLSYMNEMKPSPATDDSLIIAAIRKARSGVGLCIVSDLIELLDGHLEVTFDLQKGAKFEVVMPIDKEIKSRMSLPNTSSQLFVESVEWESLPKVADSSENIKSKTILIVEDNPEVNAYLKTIIEPICNVILVDSGSDALSILQSADQKIDLIISDLMMLEMDGLELTLRIKENPLLDKIPIIILSARSDNYSKTKILQAGVDDYIVKPFYDMELVVRCQNLLAKSEFRYEKTPIEQQKNIKEAVASTDQQLIRKIGGIASGELFNSSNSWDELAEVLGVNKSTLFHMVKDRTGLFANQLSLDPQLIMKIGEIVNKELSNSSYSLDDLAATLGISKSTLFRRVKEQTGLSANQFLREIRLVKAHEMLISNEFRSVSEVSYAVGIESPSYFAKIYFERFGVKPSSYLYHRSNKNDNQQIV